MTIWYRLNMDVRCGRCGTEIPAQKPVKVIQVAAVTRAKFRGECCEGQAPADVPRRIEPKPRPPSSFGTFREAVPSMFTDVKQRAVGEDDA